MPPGTLPGPTPRDGNSSDPREGTVMPIVADPAPTRLWTVGVDTHTDTHTDTHSAALVDDLGGVHARLQVRADPAG